MEKNKPIKRNEALKPLSREHHQALLLCWKIKTGFAKDVAPERMVKYSLWFFENHLVPHFAIEEQYVFSVLGDAHPLVKQAKNDHVILEKLFTSNQNLTQNLQEIQEKLENHVRFEERILFNQIQEQATELQLKDIEKYHIEEKFAENTADQFWL